jgi:hypothetical protein
MQFGNAALSERRKLGMSPKKLTSRGGNKRAPVALN